MIDADERSHDGQADAPDVASEVTIIPLAREEIEIQKRLRDTGVVRVRKIVVEHEEVVAQPLMQERVEVERVPVGRVVEAPLGPCYDGDVLVVLVLEEQVIVSKQWVVKEGCASRASG